MITESQFIQYLSSQEDMYVHFEYEKERYYVVYGSSKEEGTVGKGRTLGEAIYDLTEKFFENNTQLEYEQPWQPEKNRRIIVLEEVENPPQSQSYQRGLPIKITLNQKTILLVK